MLELVTSQAARIGQQAARLPRWLVLWGPPLLLMALIFFLSSQPQLPGADDPLHDRLLKKGGHALGYGLLALLYGRALVGQRVRRALPLALLLTALYALSDEWHQTFVPNRNGSLLDVLVDLVGAVVALSLWRRDRDGEPRGRRGGGRG